MVGKAAKLQRRKTEVLCLMLNCTLPCTNALSKPQEILLILYTEDPCMPTLNYNTSDQLSAVNISEDCVSALCRTWMLIKLTWVRLHVYLRYAQLKLLHLSRICSTSHLVQVNFPLSSTNISGDRALASRQLKICTQKHGGFWPNLRHFDVTIDLFLW